jgi:bilirubin oxidase
MACHIRLLGLVVAIAGCMPPTSPPARGFAQLPALTNTGKAPHRVEVALEARVARLPVVGTTPTELFTYNGAYPGPTLDVVEGDHVVVHFKNGLAEPTNVHWHGLHVPSDQDGLPMDLVAAGATRDYEFDIPPGSAGTYWYHPHPHGATSVQFAKGLVGAIRVHAAADPVPASFGDTLLVLTDGHFDADGSVAPVSEDEQMDGRDGPTFFVNGVSSPTLTWRAGGTYRLRLVNASAAHYNRLAIPGHVFSLIATDGGFIAAPIERQELLLAPSERAEVLVRAEGKPGTRTSLDDLPYDRGAHHAPVGPTRPVLHIAYAPDAPLSSEPLPRTLRDVPALTPTAGATQVVTFSEDHRKLDFLINDRKFDPERVDLHAKLGTTEVWTLVNKGDMDHPFHLHGFPFQVLDRNGRAEPFRAWRDTVNLSKDETVRVAVKFSDYAGPRVFHCHIIEHEDLGMMATLMVEP